MRGRQEGRSVRDALGEAASGKPSRAAVQSFSSKVIFPPTLTVADVPASWQPTGTGVFHHAEFAEMRRVGETGGENRMLQYPPRHSTVASRIP